MRGTLDDVVRAYIEQIEAVQKLGGRIILMASRALARVARTAGRLSTTSIARFWRAATSR